jgi:glycosyltransferase involved in cell wall biosynthesis
MGGSQFGLEPTSLLHRVEGDAKIIHLPENGYTSAGVAQEQRPGHDNVVGLAVAGDEMIPGKLSVVLPAHNEVDNIPDVTQRALEVLPELAESFEIIIVDDGSVDGTGALLDRLAAQHPEIRAVHHPKNRGYGAALTSGFQAACGDFIMFMDADQQFDIADLSYLAPFVGKYDIVAGYRIDRQDARYRILYANMFKLVVRMLFHVSSRDTDCAFKVFRADLLKSMQLESPGALINTEILAKSSRSRATYIEVGVHHYPRKRGESSGGSPRVVIRAMKETMLLWMRMRSYVPTTIGNGKAASRSKTTAAMLAVSGAGLALIGGLSTRIVRRRRK